MSHFAAIEAQMEKERAYSRNKNTPICMNNVKNLMSNQKKALAESKRREYNRNRIHASNNDVQSMLAPVKSQPICGTACKREKKISELKQVYDNKKENVITAPVQLDEARKNYLEYTNGEQKYIATRSIELRREATNWSKNTLSKWNKEIGKIDTMIDTYDDAFNGLEKLDEYYHRISKSNNALEREYGLEVSTNSTNDRKAFYEMQGTEDLQWWYSLMKWTYILLIIVFITASFLTPTTYSWKQRGIVLSLLLIYPFIISFFAVSSFAGIHGLLSMLPYNTYTRALGVSFPDPNAKVKIGPSPRYKVPPVNVELKDFGSELEEVI
jgi:hypothetical protein|uniref:Uncharacterized protein n=1 Tax=viral metagenome TaxID=1070528 RepID=A0A6C0IJF1_9ZZZZ